MQDMSVERKLPRRRLAPLVWGKRAMRPYDALTDEEATICMIAVGVITVIGLWYFFNVLHGAF